MTDRDETFAKVAELIAPFNKKGVALDRSHHLRRRSRMGQPGGDGLRRLGRGRVRHPDHDEHAGRDRDGRPARRRGREAEERAAMTEALRNAMDPADEPPLGALGPRPLLQVRRADRRAPGPARHRRARSVRRSSWRRCSRRPARSSSGKETILLGTYNYMGMTFDPDVIAAGKKALDEFGSGTTGSRVLNGTYQGHQECEEALKDFYGTRPCHGLLDRLPGQSRPDLDHRRQGRLHHPRHRQPRLDL